MLTMHLVLIPIASNVVVTLLEVKVKTALIQEFVPAKLTMKVHLKDSTMINVKLPRFEQDLEFHKNKNNSSVFI